MIKEQDVNGHDRTTTRLGNYEKQFTPLTIVDARRQRLERLIEEVDTSKPEESKQKKTLRPIRRTEVQEHPRKGDSGLLLPASWYV